MQQMVETMRAGQMSPDRMHQMAHMMQQMAEMRRQMAEMMGKPLKQ